MLTLIPHQAESMSSVSTLSMAYQPHIWRVCEMTDFDPTKNRVPFGLLTDDEKKALKAWPHGWEIYDKSWRECQPKWSDCVYRGKPVVTSVWFNLYGNDVIQGPFLSRESSDRGYFNRIGVLRIDTCNGAKTPHLEDI